MIFKVVVEVSVLGMAQKKVVTRDIDAVDASEAIRAAQDNLVTVEIVSVVRQQP